MIETAVIARLKFGLRFHLYLLLSPLVVKDSENRSTFGKVMGKSTMCCFFFTHRYA